MSGFELIAPLVMNVLPPAIDYFLCQRSWEDDEADVVSSTWCSPMALQGDVDDDDIVMSSYQTRKRRTQPKTFRRRGRPVEVSVLSLEASVDEEGVEDEIMENASTWYCFTA